MSTTAQFVLVTPEQQGRRPRRQEHVVTIDLQQDSRVLLTVSEAAHRLGVGRTFMYQLLNEGRIRSMHVGRLRRIPVDALEAFVTEQGSK